METPASILAWSRETFGERDAVTIAARTSKEVNELLNAVLNQAAPRVIAEEVADSAVMLWQVAHLLDVNVGTLDTNRIVVREGEQYLILLVLKLQRRFTTCMEELVLAKYAPSEAAVRSNTSLARNILSDVLNMLDIVAHLLAIDIGAAVTAKMKINRARNWERRDDGSFQHVGAPVTNGVLNLSQ